MGLKKWTFSQYDKELAKALSAECDVDPIVALIASSRGYSDPTELEQFILDEPYFTDPKEMADITLAAEIVNAAIDNGEKIAVFGDYDCDGVTATAIIYTYLKRRGADCCYYIPNRFDEGYGMNCDAIEKLAATGVKLILTVDNGIVCFEETALAKKLGMTVVITDHHLPTNQLPEADAVVDPHRSDCPSEFKSVCGAEVAFRLLCVMENKEPEELILDYADILSVAIIADVMPLTLENRSIVKCGIDKLRNNAAVGLASLLNVAGVSIDSVDSSKIAFGICPRINAAGRMGDASRAVELLICDNMLKALEIATQLDTENTSRQETEKKIYAEAVDIIEKNGYGYNRVIVAAGEGWHHGVVGIAASRIAERYGAPVILLSHDGVTACGSGRSIDGFSLYNAIDSCRDLMIKFGGHDQAAGVTLAVGDIDIFRKRINDYAVTQEYVPPTINIDCKLNPAALSLDLCFALKALEPYGSGNPQPLFAITDCTLERITAIGQGKHLKLLFKKGDNCFQALLFGVTPQSFCFDLGNRLDLAVVLDANYYKGEYSLSIQIKAIRPSGINEAEIFKSIICLNDYFSGYECDALSLLPGREEVGRVYKAISQGDFSPEKLKYAFIGSLGFAKTQVSIKTLEETGLIYLDNSGIYRLCNGAAKTSLDKSILYKNLLERSGKND